MLGSGAARACVTLVVAVGMHLCCCRTILLGCDDAETPTIAAAPQQAHKSCCDEGDESKPAEKAPAHDKGPCRCESAGPRVAPDAPQQVSLAPPPLLAVLPREVVRPALISAEAPATAAHAPVLRPATTLLRQHCALIV